VDVLARLPDLLQDWTRIASTVKRERIAVFMITVV
jgi:hypothetical protein